MLQTKGKSGRGKGVKVKQETLPTPQGRRVIPRITSAMKADASKKAKGKKIKVSQAAIFNMSDQQDFIMMHSIGCHDSNEYNICQ